MKMVKITSTELDGLLQRWNKDSRVYIPAGQKPAAQSGTPGWQRVEEGAALTVPAGPSAASVKAFFFPQPETMLTYTLRTGDPDQGLMKEPQADTQPQVVVGLRPCDARSVMLNNLPFQDDFLFQANRQRTVLVGFTCDTRLATCFCEQTGGSPVASEGLDLALTATTDGFLVEALTPRGEELLAGLDLPPATAAEVNELAARRAGNKAATPASLAALKSKELNTLYEAPLWQSLGDSCLNCGACTFLCPTCYCFDIQDEVVRGSGRRIRYWDSCMFPLYSLHTTGHNPRGRKVQRTRNRFLHKLKYFPERYGPFSCVGCGRCVQDCPVNIDIREVMTDLLAVE